MSSVIIRVNLDDFSPISLHRELNEKQLRKLDSLIGNAVSQGTTLIWNAWREEIRRARGVWVGDKERYEGSLKIDLQRQTPMGGELGVWTGTVFTDMKLAEEIEHGRPARDLKTYLSTSNKARTSKSGSRYLVIPFRHNTPGHQALGPAMPKAVYLHAKKLNQTIVPAIVGHTGSSRLPAGLAPKLKPEHATDPYAGMVRMAANSPKAKSSTYLTFRTMSSKSGGWIIPPKDGLELVQKVEQAVRPDIEDLIYQAVWRGIPNKVLSTWGMKR